MFIYNCWIYRDIHNIKWRIVQLCRDLIQRIFLSQNDNSDYSAYLCGVKYIMSYDEKRKTDGKSVWNEGELVPAICLFVCFCYVFAESSPIDRGRWTC